MTKTDRVKGLYAAFPSLRGTTRPPAFAIFLPLPADAGHRFTENDGSCEPATKEDREMTRYREAPVELFSPVENGVTVAVPYPLRVSSLSLSLLPFAVSSLAGWEIQSGIYF